MVLLGLLVGIYALMRIGAKGLEPGYALAATILIFEAVVLLSGGWHDQAHLISGLVAHL